jgi:hypothetical protein
MNVVSMLKNLAFVSLIRCSVLWQTKEVCNRPLKEAFAMRCDNRMSMYGIEKCQAGHWRGLYIDRPMDQGYTDGWSRVKVC